MSGRARDERDRAHYRGAAPYEVPPPQRRGERPPPVLRPREAAPAEVPSQWWIYVNELHYKDLNDPWSCVTPYQRRMMESCDKQYVRRGSGVPPSVTNHDLVNKGLRTSGLEYRATGDRQFAVVTKFGSIELECDHNSVWTRGNVTSDCKGLLYHVFERLSDPNIGWRHVETGRGTGGPRKRPKTDAMRERQRERRGRRSPSAPREVRRRSRSRRRAEAAPSEEPSRRRRAEAAPVEEPSGRSRREAAPAKEPSESSDSSSSSSSSKSSDSDRSPSLEAGAEPPEIPEVEQTGESRGRKQTIDPDRYVLPTLTVKTDTNKLLKKERDPRWRPTLLKVYDQNPELMDPQFSELNNSTGWRRCTLCSKDIGTGHEDTVSHLERMKAAFGTMTDAEKIEASKAWLVLPAGKSTPPTYINFCRFVGMDTVDKRLELAQAKKAKEMRAAEIAIKREN